MKGLVLGLILVILMVSMVACSGGASVTPTATPDNSTALTFGIANFGTPKLDGTTWSLDSTDGQGDQIELKMSPNGSLLDMTAEVVVSKVGGDAFTILLDTPEVRTLRFFPDGTVRVFVPGLVSSEEIQGTYSLGAKMHLRIIIDLGQSVWAITITDGKGQTLAGFNGPFGANKVESIRISTPVYENPPRVRATVGNIQVH